MKFAVRYLKNTFYPLNLPDSMKLEDGDIDVKVNVGDRVATGQTIAVMDLDKIQAKGINDTVIAILLNTASYRVVSVENGQLVAQG